MQVACGVRCCERQVLHWQQTSTRSQLRPVSTRRWQVRVGASRRTVLSADVQEDTQQKGDEQKGDELEVKVAGEQSNSSPLDLGRVTEGTSLQNPDSEISRKKEEADRLRAAEKFMKVGTGEAFCRGCGYEYKPSKGDPEYPISPGTYFQDLPGDWQCPICAADKRTFEDKSKEIAGFAENQGYGFGTNGLTSGQKSLLIYGSLLAFFALFCAGYLLQ